MESLSPLLQDFLNTLWVFMLAELFTRQFFIDRQRRGFSLSSGVLLREIKSLLAPRSKFGTHAGVNYILLDRLRIGAALDLAD